ncbi:MAG TPA: acyl carrier protein [Ruminiclostridium sp.]|nr:acyl carrier protein [Ruminiclostridium sp.]
MSTEYKDIMSRLNKIIKATVEDPEVFAELQPEDSLAESGLDSVSFIKLVVLIETEFDFNFDEYGMFFNNFKTLDDIIVYIQKRI